MSNYPLKAILSPHLEKEMFNGTNSVQISEALQTALTFFQTLRGIATFVIPKEHLALFQSNKALKIVLDRIKSDSQSNVLFIASKKKEDCRIDDPETLFSQGKSQLSNRQSLNAMYNLSFPIYVDSKKRSVIKGNCHHCAGSKMCTLSFDQETIIFGSNICDVVRLFQENACVACRDLSKWVQGEITIGKLKTVALIQAVANKVEHKFLPYVEEFKAIPKFISDVQSCNAQDIIDIAFVMFRVLAFETSKRRGELRHSYSIDWHKNRPKKCNGIPLFRVDVLDETQSGLQNSGSKRILFCKHGNSITFLCYTDSHDFSDQEIKNRISSLTSEK